MRGDHGETRRWIIDGAVVPEDDGKTRAGGSALSLQRCGCVEDCAMRVSVIQSCSTVVTGWDPGAIMGGRDTLEIRRRGRARQRRGERGGREERTGVRTTASERRQKLRPLQSVARFLTRCYASALRKADGRHHQQRWRVKPVHTALLRSSPRSLCAINYAIHLLGWP